MEEEKYYPDARPYDDKIRAFLDWLFDEVFNGSPDGGEIQEKAVELGLLVSCKVDPKDPAYEDACAEYDTDELYFPYWTEEAIKAIRRGES